MKKQITEIFNKEKYVAWLFLMPAILGILIFIIIPVLCSFGLSFAKWDLLNPITFVGLENYKNLFNDKVFYQTLINTIVFAISTSTFGVIIPLIGRM